VTATFAINTYTLSYAAGANGSVSGATPQTVNHGANGSTVTAIPTMGYKFVSWSDGVTTASRTDTNVTANKSVTATFAVDTEPGVETSSLELTDDAWYDANLGASGPWGEYRIYANGVLIGTKPANGVSTWDCPQTIVPAGAQIDIVRDCGFSSLSYHWDYNVPLSSSFTLPAGVNRLEAATWGGFRDLESNDAYYDPYGSDYTYSFIGSSTITNIKYSTTP